ncbi:DNA/RNA non-specific endonuclease [Candidatus Rhodobacter oscarellae]|nr:DNA/RNA non-specific endonuclease [Candidatus Rhodobacter lobularis]
MESFFGITLRMILGRDVTYIFLGALFLIVGFGLLFSPYRHEIRETASATISTMFLTFTWVKVIYSMILVGLIFLFASEIRRIWLDTRTTIGSFIYIEEAVEKEEIGRSLGLSVIERHSDLRWRFSNVEPSEFETERQLMPVTGPPIERAETVLTDLQITVQEIPVTNILEKLRRWVGGPRELSGTISKLGSDYRAALQLVDQDIVLADGRKLPSTLHFQGAGDYGQIAFDLACSLIWLDAAKLGKDIAVIGREEFCNWTMRWTEYQTLAHRLRRNGKLSRDEVTKVESALTALTHAIDNGAKYPKFWSLRADFSNLLPNEKRNALLVRIQNDQLNYLTLLRLDPKDSLARNKDVTDAEAYRVLAEARPALVVSDGAVVDEARHLWKRALDYEASKEAIKRAARATGLFRIYAPEAGETFASTPVMGIAIGPNLIATMAYSILDDGLRAGGDGSELIAIPGEYTAEFVFADAWPEDTDATTPRLPIKRILYLSRSDDTRPELALLEIERHDVAAFPPLTADLEQNAQVGVNDFAFLIGFPNLDARLPKEFMENLLGEKGGGVKRIMPGQVLAVPAPGTPSNASVLSGGSIVVDASTSGGTGGAPLISLSTGRLVGLNVAGRWQTLRDGKFAYVRPVSWMFDGGALRAYMRENVGNLSLDGLAAQVPDIKKRDVENVLAMLQLEPMDPEEVSPDPGKLQPDMTPGYDSDFLKLSIPFPAARGDLMAVASDPLHYVHHTIVMHNERRFPVIAAENIDSGRLIQMRRSGQWMLDPRLAAAQQADNQLYARNALDRGHLVRPRNVTWGGLIVAERAERTAYYYTNATPQHEEFNRRTWRELENGISSFLENGGLKATVFSGPVLSEADPIYRDVQIPLAYWKVLITEIDGIPSAVGYVLRQTIAVDGDELTGAAEPFDVVNSQVSIAEIEEITGLDFGSVRDLPPIMFLGISTGN